MARALAAVLVVLVLNGHGSVSAQVPLWDFELPAGLHRIELAEQHFEFEFTQAVRVQIFELTPVYIAGSLTLVTTPECHARIRWEEQEADIIDENVVQYRRFIWAESGHPERPGSADPGAGTEEAGSGDSGSGDDDDEAAPGDSQVDDPDSADDSTTGDGHSDGVEGSGDRSAGDDQVPAGDEATPEPHRE
jgi:hypothetical protein